MLNNNAADIRPQAADDNMNDYAQNIDDSINKHDQAKFEAANRVFHTYELVALIVPRLDELPLVRVQRVNLAFRNVIKESSKLQQRLDSNVKELSNFTALMTRKRKQLGQDWTHSSTGSSLVA